MLNILQDSIHYRFRQVKLLETALTHSSHANEQGGDIEHNERFEFLGDAVLELSVSERLFAMFPGAREGHLTRMRAKLVSKPSLAELAKELKLDACLLLGKGEESQGGRDRHSLLSDALEAVLGAVFLDGGYASALAVVDVLFASRWPQEPEGGKSKDYKSRLQELTQKCFRERPVYSLAGSKGPEHEKVFEVLLTLPDGQTVTADGPSVKRAEQRAAGLALKLLERSMDQ
ncbi:ribonuclease III [Desulfovibrio subterraneus]|jgi:ribonuclease-3|uniref:ribonuclease III n=1 Tax=Desulfovibrio subterraneus TaxID=2718620 RepID=UPI00157B1C12|nr:ribonuclease III [Desulfovibrio subterraneus]WBF67905.1 ribonuclease III [Desulfovibrio subterraneus]